MTNTGRDDEWQNMVDRTSHTEATSNFIFIVTGSCKLDINAIVADTTFGQSTVK